MNQKKRNNQGDRELELQETLAHLQDSSQSFSNRQLVNLSDLSAEGVSLFDSTWQHLDTARKRALLSRLKELSEDNVEYNYTTILKHALSDPDAVVRREAIEGLWEDDEPSLIRPLLHIFAGDASESVREAAAIALGRFAVMAECRKIDEENISRLSQPLLKVFNDAREPLQVRRKALEAVAPISQSEVTQAIWSAYRQDEPELKASAVKAMGLNCDLLWLPTVIQELNDENPEVRYEAAQAAGALGETEAAAPLIELLGDLDPEVRLAAVQALGDIGGAEAKRALRHTLRHKEQAMRDAAAAALSEIEVFEEPFTAHAPEE